MTCRSASLRIVMACIVGRCAKPSRTRSRRRGKVYPVRPRPAIDQWATVIDAWLIADKDAPRKQRHTARRVWQRLVAEHQATLSEVTVSRYVARRRVELGLATREVSIPQTHLAGAEAEVDFGEFYATIAGVVVKCWMFVMRLSHSGKAFHVAFATQAQEAFLEGHVLAFEYFGGVPGRIRYDNLKPAVIRVLKGRDRTESERFTALRSHYGFDSFFCRPGIDGAHEKGGVEGEIGRFRRRHLVPVPKVASLAELNELIAAADRLDDDRVITGRPITIGAAFAIEATELMGLPAEPFDCARLLHARVDNRARVSVRQCFYSVPARYAGRRLPVRLAARTVEIYDGPRWWPATNGRSDATSRSWSWITTSRSSRPSPVRYPGRPPWHKPRPAACSPPPTSPTGTPPAAARGDADGTRALIAILLAHRSMPAAALSAAMDRAVASGCLDPETVLIDARRDISALAPWSRSAHWPATTDHHQL